VRLRRWYVGSVCYITHVSCSASQQTDNNLQCCSTNCLFSYNVQVTDNTEGSVDSFSQHLYTCSVNIYTHVQSMYVHTFSQHLYTCSVNTCTHVQSTYVHMFSQHLYTCSVNICTHASQHLYTCSVNIFTRGRLTSVNVQSNSVHTFSQHLYTFSVNICTHAQSTSVHMFS
jgi:hypothetical protein